MRNKESETVAHYSPDHLLNNTVGIEKKASTMRNSSLHFAYNLAALTGESVL